MRIESKGVTLKWQPPCDGYYKVNTNAAVNMAGGNVRIGIIVQNSLGQVMASSSQKILVGYPLQITETITVLRGHQFVREVGLWSCVFETDT